jgi:hypothetical protein
MRAGSVAQAVAGLARYFLIKVTLLVLIPIRFFCVNSNSYDQAFDSSTSQPMFTSRTGPFFQGIFAIYTGLSKLELAHCSKLSSSFFSSSTCASFGLELCRTRGLFNMGGFLFSTNNVPPIVSLCYCGVVPELPSCPTGSSSAALILAISLGILFLDFLRGTTSSCCSAGLS